MACECIRDIELRFKNGYADKMLGKKVLRAKFSGLVYPLIENSLETRTSSVLDVSLEGSKRAVQQQIIHAYCPFCGKKYKAENVEPT